MNRIFQRTTIEKIPYSANTPIPRDLDKSVYKHLDLVLKVVHTNGAAPVITAESLSKLITKLTFSINGQDTFITVPFYHLYFMNMLNHSKEPYNSIDSTVSSQVTSYLHIRLPFAFLRAVIPEDSLLDARGVSSFVMNCQWSNSIGTDVDSIDTGTELQIYPGTYANMVKPNHSRYPIVARNEISYHTIQLDATGAKLLKLPTQSLNQYRRFYIYTFNSSSVRADAMIDNIILKSGSFYHVNVADQAIGYPNQSEFSYSKQTGLYVLDVTTDGKMMESIDARRLSELVFDFNSIVSNGSLELIAEKPIYYKRAA